MMTILLGLLLGYPLGGILGDVWGQYYPWCEKPLYQKIIVTVILLGAALGLLIFVGIMESKKS